jgi:hypothetical protein
LKAIHFKNYLPEEANRRVLMENKKIKSSNGKQKDKKFILIFQGFPDCQN